MAYFRDESSAKIHMLKVILDGKEQALAMARGDLVTTAWAEVFQDADEFYCLPVPEHIDCHCPVEAVGGCAVVDSVTMPDEETP